MNFKFLRKKASTVTPEDEGSWLECPRCEVTYREPQYYCQNCHYYSPSRWLSPAIPRSRWRRRILLIVLFLCVATFFAHRCRDYIPNPFIMGRNPTSDITATTKPGEWTNFSHNPGNTRFAPTPVSLQGQIRWSFDIGYATGSLPAVKDGMLYVGGHFKVHALETATGKQVWEAETTGPVHSSPAIANGLLYLGLLDGRLLALHADSGKLRWEFNTDNFVFSSPKVLDGVLYLGSGDGAIYAIDAETSEMFWRTQSGGNVLVSVAVEDGILYALSSDRRLYCLSAKSGARRLHFRMYWSFVDSPVAANGLVYFVASDGRLYSIIHGAREFPGQFIMLRMWLQFWLWRLPVPMPPRQPGSMWRVSPNNPRRGFISSPAVTPEALYIGDQSGVFYAKNAVKGKTLWEFKADAPIMSSPLVLGDTVYFGTKAGTFYALDRHNKGKVHWKVSLGAPIKMGAVYGDDLIFVRTEDGKLHAIE